jgi:hypothetical protein
VTTWHADATLAGSYAGNEVDDELAFSLEAHLIGCAQCRALLATRVDPARLAATWSGVVREMDAPRPRLFERALLRLRTPDYVARLLAATPSLRASWLTAVTISLGFAVGAAHAAGRAGLLLFLIVAPLLPVAGVAAAYGPRIDPTYEIGLAAPIRSFRLLLIRAAAVLGTTTALAAVASATLPHLGWAVVGWLLPSLALSLGTLALATSLHPVVAAGTVAGAWISLTVLVVTASRDELAAFHATGQTACAIVALVAAVVLRARRDTFDARRTR